MTDETIFPVVREGDIGAATVQTVDARELHAALGVGKKFADWARRRIDQLGLEENVDYVRFDTASPFGEAGNRGARVDYALTLEAAKHMAMVERNDTGRRVRNYFIECERRLNLRSPEPAIEKTGELTFDQKMEFLAFARDTFGADDARRAAVRFGLLDPPPEPPTRIGSSLPAFEALLLPEAEAWACLRRFAGHKIGSETIGDLFLKSAAQEPWAAGQLIDFGFYTQLGEDGRTYLGVLTNRKRVQRIFAGSAWDDGRWDIILLRLPGARAFEAPPRGLERSLRTKPVVLLPIDLFRSARLHLAG